MLPARPERIVLAPPAPDLAPVLAQYWSWAGGPAHAPPLFWPGPGGLEILIHRGDPCRDGATGRRLPRVHLLCARSAPVQLVPTGRTAFVAVRVRAGTFSYLHPMPVTALADALPDARALWPHSDALADALASLDPVLWSGRLDRFVRDLLRTPRGRPLGPAIEAMERECTRIDTLARDCGLGRRRFEQRLLDATGCTPSRFRRLSRLRRSLRRLAFAPPALPLTALLDDGYHDQAHQTHEFRELTGMTPRTARGRLLGGAHSYNPAPAECTTMTHLPPEPAHDLRR